MKLPLLSTNAISAGASRPGEPLPRPGRLVPPVIISAVLLTACLAPSALRAENLAVTGDTVFTAAGAPLKNGVVLVRAGKIEASRRERQDAGQIVLVPDHG